MRGHLYITVSCTVETWPSLVCEELSKQLKFPGRIAWSQVLSQVASSFLFFWILFSASAAAWRGGGKQVQHNSTQLNTMHSCWSSRENKDWIKVLQCCRCTLSPETCFSGFRDKAFYFTEIFINSITNSHWCLAQGQWKYFETPNKEYIFLNAHKCSLFL